MDKSTSVIAAFNAGKLPSTQQFNQFIDWLNNVGITHLEPQSQEGLSSQGKLLANDLRTVLDAYKKLANNKNGDNALQRAIWHLASGDVTITSQTTATKDQALDDVDSIRNALRTLVSIAWGGLSSEGTSLFNDFLSVIRLSLADAAELIEEQAGWAKESLRDVEKGVQDGERDALGRDKKRLEEEKGDVKVQWEHGMDTVKSAGSTVIDGSRKASETIEEKKDQTSNRLQDAYLKICDRAQSDPEYRKSFDTLFTLIQTRLNQTLNAASDPSTTLSTFIQDPTPEQHIPKALSLLRTIFERLSGTSLDPFINKLRSVINMILQDEELKTWFNDFFESAKCNFAEPGYARSDEARKSRRDLRVRWRTLLEKDDRWKASVDSLKSELQTLEDGLTKDNDLQAVREAHEKLGRDVETGLVEPGVEKAKQGLQAAMEQATWFWQDLFRVYIPKILNKMKDVPIPRTEYKDPELEFVLENLDVSSFNLLPSHVYIRNITDIDINTAATPSEPSKTAVGALTHIQIQALQMTLNDVSFWYKDKTASIGPSEFTGLLGVKLPEKGIDVDLKVRLIPVDVKGNKSREHLKHFNVIEKVDVKISEDITMEVRDTNHSALERTLTEQIRGSIEWVDAIAYDTSKRREWLIAAIWSEIGRIQREAHEDGRELGWHATGTGVIVEQQLPTSEDGQGILSGDKRGPIGTASESLRDRVGKAGDELGVDVNAAMDVDVEDAKNTAGGIASEIQKRAAGAFKEGQKQVNSFKRSVDSKVKLEQGRDGWESAAFDFA
ncbi:hypothetical protein BDQ17DRAFT_1361282 [Cyathus striatus]|nr:hypothetical protein BDQ17DRAFT_1361282 [Cyathus striatus]